MTHVLIISIGPVQEFIASGRKCRDLWFGSWLLSELSLAAARAIATVAGHEALVFPGGLASLIDGGEGSVANKLVARVEDPQKAAVAASEAVAHQLTELARAAFQRVGRGDPARRTHFNEPKACDQVDELIECLWSHASEAAHGGYAQARAEAESLLTARKSTKLWPQPSWAGGVPKSSLDGVRESVLHESLFDTPRGAKNGGVTPEERRRWYGVHGAERLCGIGLLKRFGRVSTPAARNAEAPEKVFSTPHLAALPYLDGLARRPGGKEAFDTFVRDLDGLDPNIVDRLDVVPGEGHPVSGKVDGSLLFPARLREAVLEVTLPQDAKTRADDADALLSAFFRACKAGEPAPYFAVLLADGDHMGNVINQLTTPDAHQELSNRLAEFASEAGVIVRKHSGALIYSGGDDVLAFLPAHKVLDCATQLANDFADRLADVGPSSPSPTLSMGIVLAHALVPLDETLAEARSAEKAAKAVPGKDALCIRVIKRGGEAQQVIGRRDTVIEQLTQFIKWHRGGELSSKAQYELAELSRLSRGATNTEKQPLEELLHHQAARVIDRRRARGGGDLSVDTGDRLQQAIETLGGPAEVGQALYVAQLVARALDQADPKEMN